MVTSHFKIMYASLISLICATLVSILGVSLLLWYLQLSKYSRCLSNYPGPSSYLLTAKVSRLFAGTSLPSLKGLIADALNLHRKYGTIVKVMLLNRPRLLITDPKAIEFVLTSTTTLSKSDEYTYFKPWLGKGLLTIEASQWKSQRKLISPCFHFQNLEKCVAVFNFQTDVLMNKLQQKVGENPIDIFPDIALCTLDIICEAIMGTVAGAQKRHTDSDYVRSSKELLRVFMRRSLSPIKMWNFLFKCSTDYQSEQNALSVLYAYSNFIVTKRRRELTDIKNGIAEDSLVANRKPALLDILLQSLYEGIPLSTRFLMDQVNTFIFAGHDTSASCVSFTLYCLAKNPEVQQRAFEELRNIFPNDAAEPVTYNNLQKMRYLEMVIKESLRLYPTVPFISRNVEKDIEFNGGILPKGLSLYIFIFGLHRNPELYPNPDKFDPERFSPGKAVGRSHFAYIPFSAGLRNCIGHRFALLEMKVILSKLLINFELLPVPEHEPKLVSQVVLKSDNGLPIILKKRKI